ncbi:hypothetical protein Q5752_004521 [Cryptotrichosporon argae]
MWPKLTISLRCSYGSSPSTLTVTFPSVVVFGHPPTSSDAPVTRAVYSLQPEAATRLADRVRKAYQSPETKDLYDLLQRLAARGEASSTVTLWHPQRDKDAADDLADLQTWYSEFVQTELKEGRVVGQSSGVLKSTPDADLATTVIASKSHLTADVKIMFCPPLTDGPLTAAQV